MLVVLNSSYKKINNHLDRIPLHFRYPLTADFGSLPCIATNLETKKKTFHNQTIPTNIRNINFIFIT